MPIDNWSPRETSLLREGMFDRGLEGEALYEWLISMGLKKPRKAVWGKVGSFTVRHRQSQDTYSPALRARLSAEAKLNLAREIEAAKAEAWRTPKLKVSALEMYKFITKV